LHGVSACVISHYRLVANARACPHLGAVEVYEVQGDKLAASVYESSVCKRRRLWHRTRGRRPGPKTRSNAGAAGEILPTMRSGEEYRPITDGELKRTSVYALAIQSWSGKRNWAERADQSDEWAQLGEEWLA
jgi:hypothetical protein